MDEKPPENNELSDAEYFSKFFGANSSSTESTRAMAENSLLLSFATMSTFYMVKQFIYTSGSPEEVRNELISRWKASVWELYNKDINLHAQKMNTDIGKIIGPMVGDSESMRVEISKRIRNVEKQIRRILTDPSLDNPPDGGEYPQS